MHLHENIGSHFTDNTVNYPLQHIVCVTGNGSLVNNKYFSEDLAGYVIVPVNVSDSAGSDVAVVKV